MKRSLLIVRSFVSILFLYVNIILNGQTVILSENFSGFTTGSHSTPSTNDLSGALDLKTQSSGWSGYKIYSAGGEIKLGTSDIPGWIETPSINFTGFEGNLLLKFDISGWPGDAASVQISLNGSALGSTITPSDGFQTMEVPVSPGISSGKIKFESLEKRFFLDNILLVTQNATSVQEINQGLARVRIFPNPTGNIIFISNAEEFEKLVISDINGIIYKIIEITDSRLEVSLADLPPGIYILRLFSNKGLMIRKIVKQH